MIIEIILFVLIFVAFFVGHLVGYKRANWELDKKIRAFMERNDIMKNHPHTYHEGGHL